MCARTITDATSISSKCFGDLTKERKRSLVHSKNLNIKYRRLASVESDQNSELLYGDNLKKEIKRIECTSKLGQNYTMSSRGRKFFPASKNGYSPYNRRGANATRGQRRYQPYQPPMNQRGRPYNKRRGNLM